MKFNHIPVLFEETINSLDVRDGGIYVDWAEEITAPPYYSGSVRAVGLSALTATPTRLPQSVKDSRVTDV